MNNSRRKLRHGGSAGGGLMSNVQLQRWGMYLARELGVHYEESNDGVILTPVNEKFQEVAGQRDSIHICANPLDPSAWQNRLRYIEQSVAQAILAGPVGFTTILEKGPGEPTGLVRLAFGLSLTTGCACRRRYTAYYLENSTFFVQGTDSLFDLVEKSTALDMSKQELAEALEEISKRLPQIETQYLYDQDVIKQLDFLNKNLGRELRDLDRLYLSGHGKYARLIGKPPQRLRGEDAIEAEYMNRMEDIVARHQLAVRFEPLSLGLVYCSVQKRMIRKRTELRLPFLPEPLRNSL